MKPIRKNAKKASHFSLYQSDVEVQAGRDWLIHTMIEKVVLVVLDWSKAARPRESACLFEAFFDASDIASCGILCQRDEPEGPRV